MAVAGWAALSFQSVGDVNSHKSMDTFVEHHQPDIRSSLEKADQLSNNSITLLQLHI